MTTKAFQKEYFKELENKLPDFATSSDLVRLNPIWIRGSTLQSKENRK